MRALVRALWAFAVLVAFSQPTSPQSQQQPSNGSVYALEEQAMRAYEDKDYSKSAQLFDAAFSAGLNRSEDAYNAACSPAGRKELWPISNGQPDGAFVTLIT